MLGRMLDRLQGDAGGERRDAVLSTDEADVTVADTRPRRSPPLPRI